MVIYDLICEYGHQFEGWFKNADDLSSQQENGLLTCPYCDTSVVNKKVTAAKLGKKSNASLTTSVNHTMAVGGNTYQTGTPESFAKLQKMLGKVHDYIDKNFTDVGNRFTEEAISMHRGEKEASNIRGTVNKKQLKKLADEGVQAMPLPAKPIDKDKLN